ncbi:hypothetical protein BDY19DRAFT_974760 [Irpex rosettiformis]|uniref:Uncharacterized protein n=1 Tax=Irpex rosettiformis TaxID=378272 RepID=A0ACB8TPN4_9APHY|nr:hypothetical protein BDY19DRAFT_974760 [Irpex rosettiformis]
MKMFFRTLPLFFALATLFAILTVSNASPMKAATKRDTVESREWSNSKRMAAGLPPRPPRRKPAKPSKVRKDQFPSPSPSPSPHFNIKTFKGRIAIKPSVAAPLVGYVSGGSPARVDVKGAYGGDLEVQLKTQFLSKVPVNLEATIGNFTPPYIGGSGDDFLSAHSSASVPITNVPATLAYQQPTSEGASAIWVFDYRTHQLIPRWTNTDGSAPSVVIGYNWQKNELFLTGDLVVYNSATGSKAIAVVRLLYPTDLFLADFSSFILQEFYLSA